MKPTIDVYLGGPIQEQSENAFLNRIKAAFREEGRNAIIFGNFFVKSRQIDFFLITEDCACHVELKAFNYPISGGTNGFWLQHFPDRSPKEIGNPYQQALACKFALSDTVNRLLEKDSTIPKLPENRKFYHEIESVVCVYPKVPEGSDIQVDFKVKVCGYEALWELLCQSVRSPKWDRRHWESLAMSLNLVKEETLSTLRDFSIDEAHASIQDFKKRFLDFYEPDLKPLISTGLKTGDDEINADGLQKFLLLGKHGQLFGPSGCGKTHLAYHMAMFSIRNGQIVIFASAKNYEGGLNSLLNQSISYLYPGTARDFLDLCSKTSTPTALIIDGFNECPLKFQKDLLKDLQAFFLKNPMPILITSQQTLELPSSLSGKTYCFNELSQAEKKKVFESYSSNLSYNDKSGILEPFTTALEISMAAECSAEIKGQFLTRAELYEKYSRRCLREIENNLAVRQMLINLANKMAKRLVKSLPLSEVERIGLPFSDLSPDQVSIFNDALDSALLETKEGRCSFRHELFQHFFEALAFLREFSEPHILAVNLKLPRYSHIQELVVSLLEDEESVRECLLAVSDVRLLRNSLLGYFGDSAKNIVIRDAHGLIKRAIQDLEHIDVELIPSVFPIPILQLERAAMWTPYEHALMKAIGEVMGTGLCMDEVFYLVRKTDQVSQNQLLEKEGSLPPSRLSELFANLYIFSRGGPQVYTVLPVTVMVLACHNNFSSSPRTQTKNLVHYCKRLEERTHGELYLLCLLLRIDNVQKEFDGLGEILCSLGTVCWNTKIYHLRLELLHMIRSFRHKLSGENLEAVKRMLPGFETKIDALNFNLLEVLGFYDLVESPVELGEVEEEIRDILRAPDCQETWGKAYAVVANQFEDIFQEAYYEAIQNLPQRDKMRLCTLATLGAPNYGFSLDWLLVELLKFNDPKTLLAFQRWATELNPESSDVSEATVCYVTACVGCSHFMDLPPRLKNLNSDDYFAWQTYGEIIFWVNKPDLSDDEINRRCIPLWAKLQTKPFEAIDPLRRFKNSNFSMYSGGKGNPVEAIYSRFEEQIRDLMEFGLKNRSHLSTLFIRQKFDFEKESTQFLISQLGKIGNSKTINILEPFMESPECGLLAVQAVKKLKGDVAN